MSQFTQYLSTFAHLLPAKLKNDIHYHKIIILTKLFKISILVEKTTKEHVSYHVPIFPVRHFREALPVTNNMCHMNGKTALEEKIKKNPSTGWVMSRENSNFQLRFPGWGCDLERQGRELAKVASLRVSLTSLVKKSCLPINWGHGEFFENCENFRILTGKNAENLPNIWVNLLHFFLSKYENFHKFQIILRVLS